MEQNSKFHRKGKLSATLVAVAVFTASSVFAAEPEWQEVMNTPEVAVEVDVANIRFRERMLTAWVRLTTQTEVVTGGLKYRSTVSLTVFDCDAEKSGISSSTAFAGPRSEGKVVHTEEGLPAFAVRLSYQRPGTPEYRVLEFVCERGEKRNTAEANPVKSRTAELERAIHSEEIADSAVNPRKAGVPTTITRLANPADFYPSGSSRREEQGSPVVKACVGASGKLVREPIVTETSGFPELDAAAVKVAKATRYAAGTENGEALSESCVVFKVKFAPDNH